MAATCRACGKEIHWIKSAKSGRMIPCETKRLSIITQRGEYVQGWESHYAHCPEAPTFRKGKEK